MSKGNLIALAGVVTVLGAVYFLMRKTAGTAVVASGFMPSVSQRLNVPPASALPAPPIGLRPPINYGIKPGYTDPLTGMTYGPTYITVDPNAPIAKPAGFMPIVN